MSCSCRRSKKRREACTLLTPSAMLRSAITASEPCAAAHTELRRVRWHSFVTASQVELSHQWVTTLQLCAYSHHVHSTSTIRINRMLCWMCLVWTESSLRPSVQADCFVKQICLLGRRMHIAPGYLMCVGCEEAVQPGLAAKGPPSEL